MYLKNKFLNTAAFLLDSPNDQGASDAEAKAKLREAIAKGTNVTAKSANEPEPEKSEEETEEEGEEEETEETETVPENETEEQKTAREAKEKEVADKITAKAKRKEERVQKRINDLTAAKKNLETELAEIKLKVAENPETKLSEAEVQTRAEAIAAKKLADKELADIQTAFSNACDKLAKEGNKLDKEFDDKINDMAEQFGPIPSFMIGVLEDFENGAEVLVYLANDDDEAEKIYGFKNKPAKMTKELVQISNKLLEAKKPKPKVISKVPDPVVPVTGSRSNNSLVITEADTKNMDTYVAKRAAQREAQKKARGY